MLRQGLLGQPRPSKPRLESEGMMRSYPQTTDQQEADTSHSLDDSSIGDIDQGQEGSDDEETFVHEDSMLETIPSQLEELISKRRHLQKLSLKGNRLNSIPERFGKLSQLYYLNLSRNAFTEVPPCIGELSNLEILDMSNNGLKVLPTFLTKLPHLVGLSLVANNFEILPPIVADLPKLVILELENNPIRLPASLPKVEDVGDEESWLKKVREYIKTHRVELENALKPSISAIQMHSIDDPGRAAPERLRSSSESAGASLRAAKRMGFVMSRNATDQSYVASLHARGLSHDAIINESPPNTKPPQQQHSQSLSGPSGITQSPIITQNSSSQMNNPPMEPYAHMRSLSTFAATPEYTELQPPPPRSPLARSPFGSPWGSPRPSVTDTESQNSANSRLSTLAEEHDADSEAGDTDADMSIPHSETASREVSSASSSTDNGASVPVMRRPSAAMPSLPETVPESPHELESPGMPHPSAPFTTLFNESYMEPQGRGMSSVSISTVTGPSTPAPQAPNINRANSSTPSLPTPTSATSNAMESIAFALEEFGQMLKMLANELPPAITTMLREAQEFIASRQWSRALVSFASLLDRLTVPVTFQQIATRLSRRQQRQLATSIMLSFPELESAWRQLQRTKLLPITLDTSSQDEQLHTQLDHATRGTQSVLSLLNNVVGKSAVAAADGPEPTSEMASRVRDLSSVCIRCSGATRNVRNLLDRQATPHARTLQLSERRKFWEEVNNYLKAVISTLAAVKAALPVLPLLADGSVGSEVANLSRVAKEIPPLLEQSSYRVLLDTGGPPGTENFEAQVSSVNPVSTPFIQGMNSPALPLQQQSVMPPSSQPQQQPGHAPPPINLAAIQQNQGTSQVSLPPPTPLTASLGAAAQALISPNERMSERADGYIQLGSHGYPDH